MPATFETLWDAVKTEMVGLNVGLTTLNVRQQPLPANPKNNELTSGAFLCPATEREGAHGTNQSNDIGYGFLLMLLQKSNSDLGKTAQQTLMPWREAVRKHFHHRSPLRSQGAYTCTVEHAPAVLPDAWKQQYDASALVIRCWVLEKGN